MLDTGKHLLNRIKLGDEIAFENFMKSYGSALYYYAYGIIKQKECAEEVVSDVFLEVWKMRASLDEIEDIKSWLFAVTYRKSISTLRKERQREHLSLDEVEDFVFSPQQSPDQSIITEQEMELLNQAINKLPPKCKHVFYLAKVEKIAYKDIAAQLSISVNTVNNHVATALKQIHQTLKNI